MGMDEMNKLLAGISASSGAAATAVVVVAVLAGIAWMQFGGQGQEVVTPVVAVSPTAEAPAPQPEAPAAMETASETVTQVPEPAEAVPAPEFDEVRREADGMTVIAGRAAPGAEVKILQNGTEIARVTADGSGKFATLAMISPDGNGHVLSLVQTIGTQTLASLDEIILAPLAAPVVVAEVAAPEAAPTAETPTVAVVVADPEETIAPDAVAAETASSGTPIPDPMDPVTAEVQPPPPAAETQVAENSEAPAATTARMAEATTPATPETQPTVPATSAVEDAPTVPKTTDVAVLKSTAEGVELLNPDAPVVMDNVALDTISYSIAGDVQLSGRAQSNTRAVRVYLDNNAVVSLDVAEDGRWRGDLPNVDEGIYTLRVDEVAADGSVTSRVETPFKREAPEVLAAASAAQDGPIKAITVQKGATLWAIARERYGRGELYVRVFEANKDTIRDADLIYPGQIFDLPD